MYDELIKQCRDCIDCLCGDCKYEHLQKPGNFVPCMNALLGEAADAIEELSKPRWIPVTERLPEAYQSVIVAVYCTDIVYLRDGETLEQAAERCQSYAAKNPYVELGFVDKDGLWNEYDGFAMVCSPSCWMPLPEPPKEENNG